jgi:hypothetical protein
VFALVAFSSEIPFTPACDTPPPDPVPRRKRELAQGEAYAWTAFVAPSVPPPTTCQPVTGETAYNPSGVGNMLNAATHS